MEEHLQADEAEQDSMSPARTPEPMPEVALPPGFKEVTACLQRTQSPLTASEVPLEPIQPEAIIEPAVATVCASHIVQDEGTGVTYMDMVTTSMGQVALGSSHPAALSPRLIIEDVTNLPLRKKLITASEQKGYHANSWENTCRRHHQPLLGGKI